ncbi:MAG: hypothetical protein EZS28_053289, partial [Streblomastix strix]
MTLFEVLSDYTPDDDDSFLPVKKGQHVIKLANPFPGHYTCSDGQRNGQVPVVHLKLTDPLTQHPFFPDLFLSDEWQFVTE